MEKKKCQKCTKQKPLSEFDLMTKAPKPTMKDSHHSFCRSCVEIIKSTRTPKTPGFM